MIRSKQVTSSINFWLSLVVHDTHDRSVLTLAYLLYVFAFFSVWTLAVMFLISDLLANTLSPFLASLGIAFADIVPIIGVLSLALWSLYSIYKATSRSPLVFSEDDAHLLCQTPAARRFVTLTWLFSEWPSSVLLFLAAAATVGFALLELDKPYSRSPKTINYHYSITPWSIRSCLGRWSVSTAAGCQAHQDHANTANTRCNLGSYPVRGCPRENLVPFLFRYISATTFTSHISARYSISWR
jgi:hypothetical protein